jgi:putative membrane protein
MSEFNFEIPSKQSVKGIIFLVFPSIANTFKSAYLPLLFYVFQFFRNPEQYKPYLTHIGFGVFALVVFSTIRGFLSFKNFQFFISNDYFVLQKGIIKKQRLEISLHKIQNVHISQNFLQRFVGVVGLSIDTAGDKTTEVIIKSLSTEKALALKKALVNSKNLKEETVVNDTVLNISFSELVMAGLTQNHFNSFYLLSVIIFGLLIDIKDITDMFGFAGFVENLTTKATSGTYFTIIIIYFLTIIIAIICSVIYSVVKVMINNYGLSVKYSKEAIEIEKGLFNRVTYSLKSSKIQSVIYKTNRLKQKFGMYSLRFNQAMSAINSNKNIEIEGLKNQNLKIFEQFVFGYPIMNRAENRAKPDPYFKTQLFIKTAYLLVLINVIAISLLGVEFSVVNLLLVPWFLFLNYLRYKKSYYNYQKDYIILGEGRIDTVTNIFEHHKIQSLKIKQSFFQKKREVASITVYTASNFMTIPSMPYAEAIILYDSLLCKVESTDLDWI